MRRVTFISDTVQKTAFSSINPKQKYTDATIQPYNNKASLGIAKHKSNLQMRMHFYLVYNFLRSILLKGITDRKPI